jgi:hypothetical protein
LPALSTFYGIVIRMFFRDHAPPHFHAQYGEWSAAISIETLEVMSGRLPRRTMGLVLEWAAMHRDELQVDWELCSRHERPHPIDPLE